MKLLILLLVSVPFLVSAQYRQEDLKSLRVLEGAWIMKTDKGTLVEKWKWTNDTLMNCTSYRLQGKDTIPLETVELKYSNGTITYNPTVPNQNEGKPVTFKLSSIKDGKYTFINPSHDFPKQIVYKPSKNKLKVTISGNGREVEYSFDKEEL